MIFLNYNSFLNGGVWCGVCLNLFITVIHMHHGSALSVLDLVTDLSSIE